MKNKLFALVGLLLCCMLLISGCTRKYSASLITSSSQVPEVVRAELQKVNLERGAYFFAETFTNESAYLVFCGGEEYNAGYDVDILGLEYNYLIQTVNHPYKPVYGFYKVEYEEQAVDVSYDYGIESNYPLVIYQINGRIGEQAWPVIMKDREISIIRWWGSSESTLECEKASCKITELTEEDTPQSIVDLFEKYPDLNEYTNFKNKYKCRRYFKVNKDAPFRISAESLSWSLNVRGGYHCYIVVHKQPIITPVFDNNEHYYILLEVDLLHDRAVLTDYLIIDNQLNWEKK